MNVDSMLTQSNHQSEVPSIHGVVAEGCGKACKHIKLQTKSRWPVNQTQRNCDI